MARRRRPGIVVPADVGPVDAYTHHETVTWVETLARVEETPNPRVGSFSSRRRESGDHPWSGATTWDAAMTLARYGWPAGTARAHTMAAPIIGALGSAILRHDYVATPEGGGALDIGRYMAEIPECVWWPDPHIDDGTGRFVRLVVNISASSMVPTETIEARGAAILAFVLLAEMSGASVQVETVRPITGLGDGHGKLYSTSVLVKEWGAMLDADRLAFCLSHPAMLRRLSFALEERYPGDHAVNSGAGANYGYPADVPASDRGDLYLGRMYGDEPIWQDPDLATAWVRTELVKAGCIAP